MAQTAVIQDTLVHQHQGYVPPETRVEFESRYVCALRKAIDLLREVVTDAEFDDFLRRGFITVQGKRGVYRLSPYSQTEILHRRFNRRLAWSCMQLTQPAPTHDRMVAEYIIIKNAEDYYWKTANIFWHGDHDWAYAFACILLSGLIGVLLARMLWQLGAI